MTTEELKMNREMLRIVKTEKKKGSLENIYWTTALPNITTITH